MFSFGILFYFTFFPSFWQIKSVPKTFFSIFSRFLMHFLSHLAQTLLPRRVTRIFFRAGEFFPELGYFHKHSPIAQKRKAPRMVKISVLFAWKLLKISIFWQILPKDDHSQANLQKMAGETSLPPPPSPIRHLVTCMVPTWSQWIVRQSAWFFYSLVQSWHI